MEAAMCKFFVRYLVYSTVASLGAFLTVQACECASVSVIHLVSAFWLCWLLAVMIPDGLRSFLSQPGRLANLAQELYCTRWWQQRLACVMLSLVVGSRFGKPEREGIALWRRWWDREGGRLVWNERQRRFVESALCEASDAQGKKRDSIEEGGDH